jgi:amino acid adenylation domain-containing protein
VERSLGMIVGLLAVLKAGGAYVPLDPTHPAERLRFMIQDSAPIVLLTQSHLQHRFSDLGATLPLLLLEQDSPWQSHTPANLAPTDLRVTPHHLAYIIYTSGSTGQPKGVMVEHGGLVNMAVMQIREFAVEQCSRVLQFASVSFDASIFEILMAMCPGAALYLPPQASVLVGETLMQLVVRHGITHALLPPAVLTTLPPEADLPSIRTLIVGGDALPASLSHRWGRGRRLINAYGPTETTVLATMHECRGQEAGKPPIGRPISNARIYILDEHREPVPIGVPGELYIGGAGVARGYLNRPELTAERFFKDPFVEEPGARMYRTGDLGRWQEDGNIEFLGRNDFQVKIRGFRIELAEIEARLMEHPGVREAVVVALEDNPEEKRLVAYYTAAGGVESAGEVLGAEQLRSHLSQQLPEHMMPAAYVRVEGMPLTPNGKLDRKALPAPDSEAYASHGYEPPQGDTETKLAEVWGELLGLDRVGRQDNFFSLGGHSLLAVRAISRLRQALGVEVALRDLFAHPVVADLARILDRAGHAQLPPIAPAERSEHLPVSFAQQRLWFLAQLEGVSEAYHIPLGLHLKGDLDRVALRRALNRIVARHEALRTTFAFVDEEPVQRIAPAEESGFHLMEQDLRGHGDAQAELARLAAQEAGGSFDLEIGPLVRGRLIQMANDEHALLLTMHHIVFDGWSQGIFRNELSELYSVFHDGREDPLPELEIQYADYAVWQRRWIEGEILQQQGAYWKAALAGVPEVLELPADHPRRAQQDFAGAFAQLVLDQQLTSGLRALGQRHGTTLFMTLLAGWAALLARLSGQQDVVVGTPTANRGRTEIEPLIGFFVNTLAIRMDLSDSPGVSQLLEQAKTQALAAQQNQDIPFEQVIELVNPVRSLSHSPLFQVMFAWQNNERGTLHLPGLQWGALPSLPHRTSKFDLTVSLGLAGDRIVGGIQYATSLFEQASVERYLGYFQSLLGGMVADETRQVDRIPILTAGERHRVLYEWNETKAEFPSDKCVQELFEEQAEKTPEATAVVFEEQQLSYGELNRRANQLAHYLRKLGVKPDDRVAICVERSLEMVVALVAVLKAGGAYVPLDPAYPIERLRFMLEDSGPVAVLTQGELKGQFTGVGEGIRVLDVKDASRWQEEAETDPDRTSVGLTAEHPAYVIYTSGSTGKPKGVVVTHSCLANYILWSDKTYYRQAGSGSPLVHSIGFDGIVTTLFGPLICGQTLTVLPQGVEMEHLADLRPEVVRYTLVKVTPSHLKLLNQVISSQIAPTRTLMIGGEAIVPSDVLFWQRRFPDVRLINHFGPTEATVGCCALEISKSASEYHSIPIGRPIWNTQIYILDEHREPVPLGIPGELYIGGAGVARGYLNRPELTAEKFVGDPFADEAGARMYRTGDLGRWVGDGNIEFLGRNDFQVKIRGFRIELGEIESRLIQHPGVREAVVVVHEDGRGDKRLIAYYIAAAREKEQSDEPAGEQQEGSLGAEELRSHLSQQLPEYMVPVAYVRLESLPLTPNGKLDRKALPAPEGDAYAARGYEAPVGEIETQMAAIWAEVLKVERIGRHDNFFALGGHSLLTLRVVNLLERVDIQILAPDVFACPTIESLARKVASQSGRAFADRAICIRKGGPAPPLFLAHDGSGHLAYVPVLAPYIDLNMPIYGLPAKPADAPPLRTIEEMATRMVQMIREVQPVGPYHIAGWSLGGVLAYEIAAQLIDADQKVDFLGLFDARYVAGLGMSESHPKAFDDKDQLLSMLDYLVCTSPIINKGLQSALSEIKSNVAVMDFATLVRTCRESSLIAEAFAQLTVDQLRQHLARQHYHIRASLEYCARPIPIPVYLFAAADSHEGARLLGWDTVLQETQIRLTSVAGTHFSMMTAPNVELFGQILSKAIQTATGDSRDLP